MSTYVRVISMDTFLEQFGDTQWSPQRRRIYCFIRSDGGSYVPRPTKQCWIGGNPHKTFWDAYGIDFSAEQRFGVPVYHNSHKEILRKALEQVRVLALRGANQIASFPAKPEHLPLQKYLQWKSRGENWVKKHLGIPDPSESPRVVAAHLRLGQNFLHACKGAIGKKQYFSSQQCELPGGSISAPVCDPSMDTVADTVMEAVLAIRADTVYIGADDMSKAKPYVSAIETRLQDENFLSTKVLVTGSTAPSDPLSDLQMFTEADIFIGNCVSSFSAFASRHRLHHDLGPTWFWSVPHPDPLSMAKDDL